MRWNRIAVAVALYMVIATVAPMTVLAEGSSGDTTQPYVVYQGYDVEIQGAYAVTQVTRVIENPSDESIAYSFVFSIPEEALISNFSILIDGKTYYADVLEKEDAQERYNESVEEGRDSGLVSSRGTNTFAYSVSLSPRETVRSTLRFEQMLLKENGWYRYELFMAGSTGSPKVDILVVDVEITSTSEINEVRTEGYDGKLDVAGPEGVTASVRMLREDVSPSEDLAVEWSTGGGPMEGTLLFGEKDGAGYFVHVFDPDLEGARVPKDFVFILDISGSMGGTKIRQAKEALGSIYGGLHSKDRFSFVTFNNRATIWKDHLVKANDANKDDMKAYIERLGDGGGTNIHSGVVGALDIFKNEGDTVPIIVLLTDGRANVGLYDRSEFRKDVAQNNTVDASIFCIAFGNGADWTFLEALALENNGKAIWVKEDENSQEVIKDFIRSFSTPLVADLSFEYGDGVTDVYPTTFPAHYKGSEVLLAGRYPLWLDEIHLIVRGTSGDGEIVERHTITIDGVEKQDLVPRFWAFQRIQYLLDHMKYNGTDDASVDQITQLALEFQFVTAYTSLYVELPEGISEGAPNDEHLEYPAYSDSTLMDSASWNSKSGPSSGSRGGPTGDSAGGPLGGPPGNPSEESDDSLESPGFMGVEVLLAFIAIVSIGWATRRSRR